MPHSALPLWNKWLSALQRGLCFTGLAGDANTLSDRAEEKMHFAPRGAKVPNQPLKWEWSQVWEAQQAGEALDFFYLLYSIFNKIIFKINLLATRGVGEIFLTELPLHIRSQGKKENWTQKWEHGHDTFIHLTVLEHRCFCFSRKKPNTF